MKYLFTILILSLSIQMFAQTEKQDLKVGLVLSGGGAKGLAHIGVLKVLEEAGVRIDYISGTSMGAVVGGLYASGYNANQVDSIFKSVNFDNIIQDNLPRKAKTFYERADAEKYAIKLPFDNFKVSLPSSLSKGQNTYNLLSRNLQHVSEIDDYSKLPIPFLCVATDVEKGKQVILDKGYLPESIGASGALPSLFSPILLDGKLLIDGGVVNNYPVDEIRAKGMDVIIGVDVQDTLKSKESLKSAADVLLQINNFKAIKDMVKKRAVTDIYIKPNLDAYSIVAFDKGEEITDKGRLVAMEQFDALKKIASQQQKKTEPIVSPKKQDSITISNIEITGNDHYTRRYILGKLKLNPPQKVSINDFYQGINNLAATENFNRLDHRLLKENDSSILHLDLQETSSTQSLRLALHYDDLYRTAGLVNFTKKRLLFRNDIASLDFIIGENIRYNFDYYIDQGLYWSVGLNSSYTSFDKSVSNEFAENIREVNIIGLNRLSLDYQDFSNKIFVQTLFMKQLSLDLGLQHKYLDIETETVIPNIPGETGLVFEKSHLAGVYGQLKFDSLDNVHFPNSGFYFDGDFDLYLFSSDFTNTFTQFGIANVETKYVKSFGNRFTSSLEVSGGFKIGGAESRALDFFLGGYGSKKINNVVPFLGHDFLSLAGDGYIKTGLEIDYEIFKKNHINLAANFANVGNELFDSPGNFLPLTQYSGYAVGYGVETFLGPMEIKYTYSPEVRASEWFVTLGFRF